VTSAGVRRREDGLALRALRVGVHPGALIIHVGTDVVVRTPSRPDHAEGNVVDLLVPPDASGIGARLEGVRRLMEPVGVGETRLRYELPPGLPDEPERAAALRAEGCERAEHRVLALAVDRLPEQAPALPPAVSVERLEGPDGDVIAGRRWYAASVLDRYRAGDDVSVWRAWDDVWGAWDRERVGALARLGRAEVWLASRHGMPVATVTLLDDQDGLAIVDTLVTHPAHRRRGIGRALLGTALASLRSATGLGRIAIAVDPGSAADGLALAMGFLPVGDVQVWTRPEGTVGRLDEQRR